MVGAGTVAALALIGSGLVRVPHADGGASATVETTDPVSAVRERVSRRVRYVRLRRGEEAPPGARVIQESAPAPRVVVRLVAPSGPSVSRSPRRTVVTRTRQSGG
jgi:hypothetical protein